MYTRVCVCGCGCVCSYMCAYMCCVRVFIRGCVIVCVYIAFFWLNVVCVHVSCVCVFWYVVKCVCACVAFIFCIFRLFLLFGFIFYIPSVWFFLLLDSTPFVPINMKRLLFDTKFYLVLFCELKKKSKVRERKK